MKRDQAMNDDAAVRQSEYISTMVFKLLGWSNEFALGALKAALLINGAAAIALLTFVGNFLFGVVATWVWLMLGGALLSFAAGTLCAVMGTTNAYRSLLSTSKSVSLMHPNPDESEEEHSNAEAISLNDQASKLAENSRRFIMGSVVLFACGVILAALAIFLAEKPSIQSQSIPV